MWDFGFEIYDAIDILLMSSLLYYLYRKMRASGSLSLFKGILAVIIVWVVVAKLLHLRVIGYLLEMMKTVAPVALVIIFRGEIRETLVRMGSRRHWKFMLRLFGQTEESLSRADAETMADTLVQACSKMSAERVGALIVIQRTQPVEPHINEGEVVDARCSSRLIEQIFFKNTPLHDGAMLIVGMRIHKAACYLPLSRNPHIPKELGTRHRAALGISEKVKDAIVVVVSEETGGITLVSGGKLTRDLTTGKLQTRLIKELTPAAPSTAAVTSKRK